MGCYPNMPIGKVWIYRLLFVCLFLRLRISPPRKKLAVSNFARRFIDVQGRESPIFVNFAPQKPKIGQIGQRAGHAHRDVNITVEMRLRKRHARDAPLVKSRGVWTQDRHVWIYVSSRKRTYLLGPVAESVESGIPPSPGEFKLFCPAFQNEDSD